MQNLVLLCRRCHRNQPSFGPDDWIPFLEWIVANGQEEFSRAHGFAEQVIASDDPNSLIVARLGTLRTDADMDANWGFLPNWTPMAEWREEGAA